MEANANTSELVGAKITEGGAWAWAWGDTRRPLEARAAPPPIPCLATTCSLLQQNSPLCQTVSDASSEGRAVRSSPRIPCRHATRRLWCAPRYSPSAIASGRSAAVPGRFDDATACCSPLLAPSPHPGLHLAHIGVVGIRLTRVDLRGEGGRRTLEHRNTGGVRRAGGATLEKLFSESSRNADAPTAKERAISGSGSSISHSMRPGV